MARYLRHWILDATSAGSGSPWSWSCLTVPASCQLLDIEVWGESIWLLLLPLSSPKIHKTSCSPNTAKSLVIGRPKKRTVYYRWQPANCHVGKDGFFSDLFKERVGEKAHTVFWSREGMWFWQSEKEAEMVGWKVKDKLLHFASEMVQFIFLYLWSQRSCWWALLRWAGHESRVMLRRADLCWMVSWSP